MKGIVRGSLKSLGINALVKVEIVDLPQCIINVDCTQTPL
ncbi:hypothetical protein BVRB_020940 [Beta vulgaris subsp. vulgaris]|uniref:Uncharacterized protein n=1 Tax=Beta vulgaris subsp. vulgaris TaxID=3555 RepID=A0A0J8DUJ5_BETVV|nr:hypothetical protein BVRB_020940 [Beta vulgaris subsp. vulgaris]